MAHYLSTFPLIFFLFFLFVLFYRHFSCSQLWAVIWFSFDLVWDFLPVSRSLSFVFPLFFFFSCWLSSAYDLIWMFVAFLTATGVVSLKSYFASQYQNCNFIMRFLSYSTCTLLHCRSSTLVYLYLFIHLIFCFALIFLAWQFYTRTCHKGVEHVAANRSQQDSASPVRWSVISFLFFVNCFKRILIGQLSTSVAVNLSSGHLFLTWLKLAHRYTRH